MNKKFLWVAVLLGVLVGVSVSAETEREGAKVRTVATSTTIKAKSEVKAKLENARIEKLQGKAVKEIDRRVEGLVKLTTKVSAMRKVSTTTGETIASLVQAQIDSLNNLKIKISADTELTALKTDIEAINKSYRIYGLVLPLGQLLATADKINSTADAINALGAKLAVRIEVAKVAGSDVTILVATLTDLQAKTASAKASALAAVASVSGLKADQGDETVFRANKQALKDAHVKIKSGEADLRAAKKDANTIVVGLKKITIENRAEERGESQATSTDNQ